MASEVAALRTLVDRGRARLRRRPWRSEAGCFDLVQLRVEPRAPFGREARFCFDEATGAPTNSRVAYEGGIVEVVAVTDLRARGRPTTTWNPERVTTGGRRPRHGSGSVGSGSMQLEGVATPVPFP